MSRFTPRVFRLPSIETMVSTSVQSQFLPGVDWAYYESAVDGGVDELGWDFEVYDQQLPTPSSPLSPAAEPFMPAAVQGTLEVNDVGYESDCTPTSWESRSDPCDGYHVQPPTSTLHVEVDDSVWVASYGGAPGRSIIPARHSKAVPIVPPAAKINIKVKEPSSSPPSVSSTHLAPYDPISDDTIKKLWCKASSPTCSSGAYIPIESPSIAAIWETTPRGLTSDEGKKVILKYTKFLHPVKVNKVAAVIPGSRWDGKFVVSTGKIAVSGQKALVVSIPWSQAVPEETGVSGVAGRFSPAKVIITKDGVNPALAARPRSLTPLSEIRRIAPGFLGPRMRSAHCSSQWLTAQAKRAQKIGQQIA